MISLAPQVDGSSERGDGVVQEDCARRSTKKRVGVRATGSFFGLWATQSYETGSGCISRDAAGKLKVPSPSVVSRLSKP
jgi:hypothetical protein